MRGTSAPPGSWWYAWSIAWSIAGGIQHPLLGILTGKYLLIGRLEVNVSFMFATI